MAKSTTAEKQYAKKYYRTHPKKREEKIENQLAKQRANPKKYAKIQRDRYHEDKEYRDYKIDYAREYRKKHKQGNTKTNKTRRA